MIARSSATRAAGSVVVAIGLASVVELVAIEVVLVVLAGEPGADVEGMLSVMVRAVVTDHLLDRVAVRHAVCQHGRVDLAKGREQRVERRLLPLARRRQVRLGCHPGDDRVALVDVHLGLAELVGTTLGGVVQCLGGVPGPVAEMRHQLARRPLAGESRGLEQRRVHVGERCQKEVACLAQLCGEHPRRVRRLTRAHARSSPAYAAMSRFTPWPTNATVSSSSPFTSWLDTMIPSPKRLWRTRSPGRQASSPTAAAGSRASKVPVPRSTSPDCS